MDLVLDRYPTIGYDSEPEPPASVEEQRLLHKWEAAIGYRIFACLRWGQLGDGHISARDPELTDHFWVLGYGIPFGQATVDDLVLVDPQGLVVEGTGTVNFAAYNIHHPILEARPEVAAAAHTHTPWGTPWSATCRPFEPISQEACSFVFDQSLYEEEDLEVVDVDGGRRIAQAMGGAKLCILRNHGLLTAGASPAEAVGWFVVAERVAEVHVKSNDAVPISRDAAKEVASVLQRPRVGWRAFQWLARDLVPDPGVVLGRRSGSAER